MRRLLALLVNGTLISFAVLLCLTGCWRREASPELEKFKQVIKNDNVVIILVDTLRADHLPFYGYSKNTAPYLNSLAHESVVFEKAFSPSSATSPAIASIFTGLFPAQHGVITGKEATRRLSKNHPEVMINRVPESLETLAELMQKQGYKTFGLSDNLHIAEDVGFAQGFESFVTLSYRGAPRVNEQIRRWSEQMKQGGQYFLYLHYMDPHEPYHKRKPWFVGGANNRESLINAYDSEINYCDAAIQEMFDLMQWRENAVVIVIADHGEELWAHGKRGHGRNLYVQVTHVPLFVYHRDLKARRIPDFVSTIDLLPTMAQWFDVETDDRWRGHSLNGLMFGRPREQKEIYSELIRYPQDTRSSYRAVVQHGHHFIESVTPDGVVTEEMFNLASDPAEQNNIIEESPEMAQKLRQILRRTVNEHVLVEQEKVNLELDEETTKNLKTLGYLK